MSKNIFVRLLEVLFSEQYRLLYPIRPRERKEAERMKKGGVYVGGGAGYGPGGANDSDEYEGSEDDEDDDDDDDEEGDEENRDDQGADEDEGIDSDSSELGNLDDDTSQGSPDSADRLRKRAQKKRTTQRARAMKAQDGKKRQETELLNSQREGGDKYLNWQKRVVQILDSFAAHIDTMELLSICPSSIPIACLCPYLARAIPAGIHAKRHSEVLSNLAKVNNFNSTIALHEARSTSFVVKPESRCAECQKLIGEQSVFIVQPVDQKVVHALNKSNVHHANASIVTNNNATNSKTSKGASSGGGKVPPLAAKDSHGRGGAGSQHVVLHYMCSKQFIARLDVNKKGRSGGAADGVGSNAASDERKLIR
jgi:hypothetical protein